MALLSEELTVVLELLDDVDELQPVAESIVATAELYGPYLGKVADGVIDFKVARNIKTFNQYVNGGLTREEAMMLMMNSKMAIKEFFSIIRDDLSAIGEERAERKKNHPKSPG